MMKKVIVSVCVILILLVLTISIFAEVDVVSDGMAETEKFDAGQMDGDDKVRYSSLPWIPLIQFDRYRSLFVSGN